MEKLAWKGNAGIHRNAEKKLVLFVNGSEAGCARIKLKNKPFPFYHIVRIDVDESQRGKSYGSMILKEINKFIKEEGIPGILFNGIYSANPAFSMYENYGWEELNGLYFWYVYNKGNYEDGELLEAAISLNPSYGI